MEQTQPDKGWMTTRTLFRCIGWVLMVAIVVFTLSPVELRPVTRAPADLERFTAFAVSGGVLCLGYPRHRLGIALLVLGTVGLLEVAQHLVPSRHGHLQDSIVKAAGAFAGAVMAMLVNRRKVAS